MCLHDKVLFLKVEKRVKWIFHIKGCRENKSAHENNVNITNREIHSLLVISTNIVMNKKTEKTNNCKEYKKLELSITTSWYGKCYVPFSKD